MDDFGEKVKNKLEEYGFIIYNTNATSATDEYCIMTDGMMVFSNGVEKSLTISFHCRLAPEIVAHNMMILNEIKEVRIVYISETHFLDKENKKYVMGDEAKKMAAAEITAEAMREIAQTQLYNHILTTQKCHEC